MSEKYCVFLNTKEVGTVQVEKSGLYYRVSCSCQLDSKSMYNLFVSAGKKHRKLGICIPKDGRLCLETNVAIKELGEENMQFHLERRDQRGTVNFQPVVRGEPFSYLEELENAYLAEMNGLLGIAFRASQEEPMQVLQDSGQNP